MANSGTTQRSAPAVSAAARASSTSSTFPARSPTTVLSCAAARRRWGIGPDYRGLRPARWCRAPGPWPGGAAAGQESGGLSACETCAVQSQRDYVLRTVEERGIRFVQLWFTDVLGTPKGFNITSTELENALDEGMTFDGSAIDGFSRVQEADVLARPDPKTFQLLPWHHDDAAVARVFCDVANLDGTPFGGDPRHALRRTLERAHAAGYTFFASPEVEFFYFADADPSRAPVGLDTGSYFDLSVADLTSDLRRRSVLMLEEMGIPVEHTQHEDARSQHEI